MKKKIERLGEEGMSSEFPLMLEALEARIAPASVVNAHTVTYQDVDGDEVTVTFSKELFRGPESINNFLIFRPGENGGEILDVIDLHRGMDGGFRGLDISVTTKRGASGDGLVTVGEIDAREVDLGHVSVEGTLGKIRAGDRFASTAGIKSLTVESLEKLPGGVSMAVSAVIGSINELHVNKDISGVLLSVEGGKAARVKDAYIGGSLIADTSSGLTMSGSLMVAGDIGKIAIGGDLSGGDADWSGSVFSGGKIGKAEVAGKLLGGNGDYSGSIVGNSRIGKVFLAGDIESGKGDLSGAVVSVGGKIGKAETAGGIDGEGGLFELRKFGKKDYEIAPIIAQASKRSIVIIDGPNPPKIKIWGARLGKEINFAEFSFAKLATQREDALFISGGGEMLAGGYIYKPAHQIDSGVLMLSSEVNMAQVSGLVVREGAEVRFKGGDSFSFNQLDWSGEGKVVIERGAKVTKIVRDGTPEFPMNAPITVSVAPGTYTVADFIEATKAPAFVLNPTKSIDGEIKHVRRG